ncbi:MAG: hypothetical protein HYR63_09325 [Proteobacteria bacterium]|nr:hypothetical protein [Pseudomonadota bacterium]MBI3497513.1 hypothetical protein [Pseudomonadota bacterium]
MIPKFVYELRNHHPTGAIAERLEDVEYQLRALWGLWAYRTDCGAYRAAQEFARRFTVIAERQVDSFDVFIGYRITAISLHYLGDQVHARRHLEIVLRRYAPPQDSSDTFRFLVDQRVMAQMILARILWLQGYPDQAQRTSEAAIEAARSSDHVMTLCNALADAECMVALWRGDLPAAERSVALLLDNAAKHGLPVLHIRGRCLQGILLVRSGDVAGGLRLFGAALNDLRATRSALRYVIFLAAQAEALAAAGDIARGRAAIEEAIARAEHDEESWCMAELLRVKGEIVLMEGAPAAATTAEDCFRTALDWARRQGTLSWELRVAASLARHWLSQARFKEAHQLLAPIYGRFSEGFETADLKTAEALIEDLRSPCDGRPGRKVE